MSQRIGVKMNKYLKPTPGGTLWITFTKKKKGNENSPKDNWLVLNPQPIAHLLVI